MGNPSSAEHRVRSFSGQATSESIAMSGLRAESAANFRSKPIAQFQEINLIQSLNMKVGKDDVSAWHQRAVASVLSEERLSLSTFQRCRRAPREAPLRRNLRFFHVLLLPFLPRVTY